MTQGLARQPTRLKDRLRAVEHIEEEEDLTLCLERKKKRKKVSENETQNGHPSRRKRNARFVFLDA